MPQKNYAFRMSLKENIMLGGRDEKKAESLMKSMRIYNEGYCQQNDPKGNPQGKIPPIGILHDSSCHYIGFPGNGAAYH